MRRIAAVLLGGALAVVAAFVLVMAMYGTATLLLIKDGALTCYIQKR